MLRKLCPPRRARVFDDDFRQSELRSCNFMIEPLDQDDCDYMGTADRGPHKNRDVKMQTCMHGYVVLYGGYYIIK